MKAYLIVTGALFALIVVVHAWRLTIETNLLRDPWYYLITAIAAAMAVWAFRLYQFSNHPRDHGNR
jgi:hypothetical protein